MNKILISIVVIVAAMGAQAQERFEKGDWMVGVQSTNFGLKSSFPTEGKLELNAGISGGYFVLDKLALDLFAGMDYSKSRLAPHGYTGVNFGAGVRYYPVGNLFARVGYSGVVPVPWGGLRSYLGLKVGYDVFLARNVFFEPAIYFNKNVERMNISHHSVRNELGLSLGFGVKF